MIDSVLKGTGNSRFLKSAVPAGTSWADALAMLQAGTFPIDFNGINAEGFQQVGTPLNKANLLKDATAAQIGLPPSTTPDGMFRALGNTGELHVWRKTVVTGAAKVELEPAVSGYIVSNNGSNYNQTIKYSSTIDGKGNLSGTITTLTVAYNTSNSDLFVLKGKYFEAGTTEISSNLKSPGGVWYIPNDASIQYITGQPATNGYPYYYTHVATKMQKVVYVPAGTTTTYPVSTNPNAYQEGDDAKAAGYVVGEVVTGKFAVSFYNAAEGYYYKVSGNIDVSSSGSVSMPSTSENVLIDYSHNNNTTAVKNKFAGKFVQFLYRNGGDGRKFPDTKPPFNGYDIVYIPDNVSVTQEKVISDNDFVVDRYQPVTGYAAIPAGTTIEYLGKLGDKARVQVLSYIGTGTYGSSNPNSLTFDFVPKVVVIRGEGDSYNKFDWIIGMTDVEVHWDGDYHCFASVDGKKLSFYSSTNSFYQMNNKGQKYYAIAIG